MDDFLMYKYLQEKSGRSKRGESLPQEFKKYLANRESYRRGRRSMQMYNAHNIPTPDNSWDYDDDYMLYRYMKDSMPSTEHFDEEYARQIVSEMYHYHNGTKLSGEKYDWSKAKDVYDRYRNSIPADVTVADVYVAINAQCHDYGELFRSWFGSSIDSKIIESAIVFWFKDSDYDKGFKLGNYFAEGF